MARQKITEQAVDLEELTDKQFHFVELLLEGKSQIEAYKTAYDAENMADASIRVAASRLRHNAKVALTIDTFTQEAADATRCSKEDHLKELARLRMRSEASGNMGAAVQAEQLRGKVAGHYVDQTKDVTPIDPMRTLDEIAQHSPDLAEKLAKENGIQWTPETKH